MPEIRRAMNYQIKCAVCGDSTVGKSALTQVFCSDGVHYPKTYTMTTGVDLVVKSVHIPSTPDSVEFLLYDMSGKDVFDDLVEAHLQKVKALVLVYDLTNMESFENIPKWHKKIEEKNAGKIAPGILVANKVDLTDRQVVSSQMGQGLADQLNMQFFECSAKDMRNVETSFHTLAQDYYNQHVLKNTSS